MPTPPSPWRLKVLEVLADGEWHTYDELAEAAGPLVPPGLAKRRAEYARRVQRHHTAPAERRFTRRDPVETGQRRTVVATIHTAARTGLIEADGRRARLAKKGDQR
jgi:hypothetical protein